MRKAWLVAKATYRRRVRSTLFLLLTFGIPLLMIAVGAVTVLTERGGALPQIGYVDRTGELATVNSVVVGDEMLHLTSYVDAEAAQRALRDGDIAGYLVVPEGYFTGTVPVFYGQRRPSARLQSGMTTFMRRAMLPDAPDWILDRLEDPSNVAYVALETGERVAQGPGLIIREATPAFLAMIFVFSVFISANQMGSAVVREKEQRAMEMVITSISPRQLVTGKILGTALLTLTQVGVWIVGAVITIVLALFAFQITGLSIPWPALLWATLLGIPGYFLYATLGAGLGVIAGDKQQAQQLAGMLGFLGMGPLYFVGAIIDNLDGPLGVGLTLFPLTAPTMALFRMALTEVPTWQLGAALTTILISLVVSVWFVARIFRAAMLMYGQTLQPREILEALRQA
ncbi:MAG: ABC transporter permease [Anaerolineales bacterium]